MQKIERYLPYLLALCFMLISGYLLQEVQQYVFFDREQQQILAWDWDLLWDRYSGVGGIALFKAHYVTQLFYMPWAGPIITAILATIASLCLWVSVKPISIHRWLFPLCLIPFVFELSNLNDANYHYWGFMCLVILTVFMAIYGKWVSRLSLYSRMALTLGVTLLLFWMAAPMCLLFAVYVILFDAFTGKERWYYQILSLVVGALAVFYAVRWCWLPSNSKAFTQDLFYNYLLPLPDTCKYSWISLLAMPVLYGLSAKMKEPVFKARIAFCLVLSFGVGFLVYSKSEQNKRDTDILLELQHHVVAEEWDEILRNPYAHTKNYLVMNYVNLALSKKGMMLTHFFNYEQVDPQNIVVFHEFDDNQAALTFIYAHVNYQMGDMGGAQNHAHDTFVLTHYGNPNMLQMLIKTNLIKGAYEVADKYITLLEKSWHYREWAEHMRTFLYNDKAVVADADLGRMRKSLPTDDTFTLDPEICLYKTLETNPEDIAARDYMIAYLYIYRDQDDINRFVETFYQTPVLNPFPQQLQEAFLLVNDFNFDYCREHGVSEENIERYKKFMTDLDRAERQGIHPAQALRKEYGNTTWYNFMFK